MPDLSALCRLLDSVIKNTLFLGNLIKRTTIRIDDFAPTEPMSR